MVTNKTRRYDKLHQFDPLMPEQARIGPLLEHALDEQRPHRRRVRVDLGERGEQGGGGASRGIGASIAAPLKRRPWPI